MTGKGRPAFSSAYICSICLAAFAFQGGGFVRSCATWSLMSGVQTPPKSGSLASACQSRSVGGELIASLAVGSAAPAAASEKTAAAPRTIAGSTRLMRIVMRLEITLFESHNETLVNSRVPLKVPGYRRGTDVLDREIRKCFRVQFEAGVIGGEYQTARRPQQFQRSANHAGMIALHVEHALHALGIGKSGRVEEDQVEARATRLLFLEPSETIGAVQRVI